jgi:hypothetical protein
MVGPAGLPHSKEGKHLAGAETVGNPDISRCLSQPSVSLGTEGGIDLHIGRRYTGVSVRPDFEWPGMWRVHLGDRVGDMTNLARAKDAGITWARPRGLGSSEVARWHRRETPPGGVQWRIPLALAPSGLLQTHDITKIQRRPDHQQRRGPSKASGP